MGSGTFRLPNEARPRRVGGRLGEPSLPCRQGVGGSGSGLGGGGGASLARF